MRKTLMLAAAAAAMALGGANFASAAPVSGLALQNGGESNLVQHVARRRVCTFRRGVRRCVWYGNRRGMRRWRWGRRRGARIRIYF